MILPHVHFFSVPRSSFQITVMNPIIVCADKQSMTSHYITARWGFETCRRRGIGSAWQYTPARQPARVYSTFTQHIWVHYTNDKAIVATNYRLSYSFPTQYNAPNACWMLPPEDYPAEELRVRDFRYIRLLWHETTDNVCKHLARAYIRQMLLALFIFVQWRITTGEKASLL